MSEIVEQEGHDHGMMDPGRSSKTPLSSVKSFNFMGTTLRGLTTMDMFIDTWIHGFAQHNQYY